MTAKGFQKGHQVATTFRQPTGHLRRLGVFGVVGVVVFLFGLGIQELLTGLLHWAAMISFAVQGIASIELSYLLNWRWTWRSESPPFWRSWLRFHSHKVVSFFANLAVYGLLVRLGVNYLAANVATTAVFTVVNYAAAHWWSFQRSAPADPPAAPPGAGRTSAGQTVSVVIPCRASERTIRPAVDSLLGQSYPGLVEVILVGSADDTTWQALADVTDPRLVILEWPQTPGRDSNVKRDAGVRWSRGDIVALTDSDMIMQKDWLSRGVSLLSASGARCVAGGMTSAGDSFWGRFVDGTRMAAKTPRIRQSYLVTGENFGAKGQKPPITANVILTRAVYDQCPLDVRWTSGYEDYEWFWRMARTGNPMTMSGYLTGRHHHRQSLRALCQEYRRSGSGCARFIRQHPSSPLARKRAGQAAGLPLAAFALALAMTWIASRTSPAIPVTAAGLLVAALAAWEYSAQWNPEALAYPIINFILVSVFLLGLLGALPAARPDRPATQRPGPEGAVTVSRPLRGCPLPATAAKDAS